MFIKIREWDFDEEGLETDHTERLYECSDYVLSEVRGDENVAFLQMGLPGPLDGIAGEGRGFRVPLREVTLRKDRSEFFVMNDEGTTVDRKLFAAFKGPKTKVDPLTHPAAAK